MLGWRQVVYAGAPGGAWLVNLLGEAENLWFREDRDGAILRWHLAAERGYESAQNNLAYALDQDKNSLCDTPFATPVSNDTARTALKFWMRSSAQRNIDALVKVGDYYYHGLGVPDEPEALRWEKAAGYYHSAVETHVSALAMWNLGWMYEHGRGVTQDFHLAKRYYDMALETNTEAAFPVLLSLAKLHMRALWHSLTGTGGKGRALSLWGEDTDEDVWHFGRAKAGEGSDNAIDAEREPTPDEDPIHVPFAAPRSIKPITVVLAHYEAHEDCSAVDMMTVYVASTT
ncbi:HCP-like protein [Auricularia subglabra TFB-10046 SS5]|nr:HCP-like protein [Auricularia subglabra TFB-10046 SS5]